MANLGKIVYLSKAQKDELFSEGTVTSNGTTIVYNANDLYITPDGSVEDVQINNTSIIANGVANIPIATQNSKYGLMKTNGMGVNVNSTGELHIATASTTALKTGTNTFNPVTPSNINVATFYGLAKAAGDTTQASSTNEVGIYTDAAKVAIQKMLGIYEAPWELIREDEFTNAEVADHIITVDSNGNLLNLTDALMLFELPNTETASSKGYYGQVHFLYDNEQKTIAPEPGAFSRNANESAKGAWYKVTYENGLVYTESTVGISNTNSGYVRLRFVHAENTNANANMGIFITNSFNITKINIKQVTGTGHYKLYGRRAWQ